MQTYEQKELRILMLEDSPADAELNERELRKAGLQFTAKRVDSREAFTLTLKSFHPDLILSDYNLPGFSGIAALGIARHDCPEVPVIFVTGALSDAEAANLINAGAKDYVLKDRLARLAPAVQRALSVEQGVKIRKLTEAQLQEKTELLENVINSSRDYIFVKDRELRTILCNAVFARALGKKPEDLYGKTDIENGWDAELVKGNPEKGIRGFEQDDLNALAGNVVHSATDLGNVGSEIRHFDSVKVPLKSADGRIFGLLGISRDVTERKLAEETLKRYAHDMNERAKEMSCLNDIITMSLIKELSVDQLLDKCVRRMPDAWPAPSRTCARIRLGSLVFETPGFQETTWKLAAAIPLAANESGVVEVFYKGDENENIKTPFLDEKHALINSIAMQLGLSLERRRATEALQQNQAELQEAQRIAHVGNWRLDLATNHVFWSEELYRMQGLNPDLAPPDYDEHHRLFTPESWEQLHTALSRTQESGVPYDLELEMVRPDGSHGWMLARGEALRDAGGSIVAIRGVAADITERKQTEENFQRFFNLIPDLVCIASTEGHFLKINPMWQGTLGYTEQEILATPFIDFIHPEDRDATMKEVERQLAGEATIQFTNRYRDKSGSYKWLEWRATPAFDKKLLFASARDITERIKSEERLRLTAKVFENTMEGITVTDMNNNILEVNDAFTRITGYQREEVLGKTPGVIKSGLHDKDFYAAMWQAINTTGHWRGDIWNRRKDGEIYPEMLTISAITDAIGNVTNYVGIFSDITLLKKHEKQLEHIAHYDALTGIPNRVLLSDRLQQAIAFSKREKKLLAVCYLDLDGFKAINDSMGHEAGDQVLIEISRRIKDTVREGDTVARLGGDEFVVLLTGLDVPEECAASLNRLLDAVAQPIAVLEKFFKLSASIGVSLYPHDDDPDILLRHADQAMYTAKQSGRNRYYLYDTERDQSTRTRHEFTQRIRQGLEKDEFEFFFQPKVDLRSRRPVGAEALIRWRHPERGLLSPAEFLPAIEDTALDIEMGEWVITTALDQLSEWQQSGLNLELSINISAFHMQSPEFSEKLKQKLSHYPGLPHGRLQIEILETAALKDIAAATRIIESCRNFGVGFALDDFGTGYSSLSYLSNLPVDTLKIDQSFVRDMLEDKGDFAIVQGIIALSSAFNLKTVAEGVATDRCFNILLDMGCEIGQGYAIAHPMPAADFLAWYKRKSSSGA